MAGPAAWVEITIRLDMVGLAALEPAKSRAVLDGIASILAAARIEGQPIALAAPARAPSCAKCNGSGQERLPGDRGDRDCSACNGKGF